MNKTLSEGIDLVKEIIERAPVTDVQKVFFPSFTSLTAIQDVVKDHQGYFCGAQNCHAESSGAFTGDVSAEMIKSTGVEYVIVGHSERRAYYGENNQVLKKKLDQAISNQLIPVYCVGETLKERESKKHFTVITEQLSQVLFHLSPEQFSKVVLAYEPVWAIGTGITASTEQAQEVHAYMRSVLSGKYGEKIAAKTSILYGGSCKPGNAEELFACEDVDGGLIGGASLNAKDFLAIINSF